MPSKKKSFQLKRCTLGPDISSPRSSRSHPMHGTHVHLQTQTSQLIDRLCLGADSVKKNHQVAGGIYASDDNSNFLNGPTKITLLAKNHKEITGNTQIEIPYGFAWMWWANTFLANAILLQLSEYNNQDTRRPQASNGAVRGGRAYVPHFLFSSALYQSHNWGVGGGH